MPESKDIKMLQRYRRIVFKGVYKFSNNKSEMQN
jgi:hypothetical protein